MSSDRFESVRMSPELVAKLEAEGSAPVHVFGIERHDDGTLDLILRTPEPFVYVDALLSDEALEQVGRAVWNADRSHYERMDWDTLRGAMTGAIAAASTGKRVEPWSDPLTPEMLFAAIDAIKRAPVHPCRLGQHVVSLKAKDRGYGICGNCGAAVGKWSSSNPTNEEQR